MTAIKKSIQISVCIYDDFILQNETSTVMTYYSVMLCTGMKISTNVGVPGKDFLFPPVVRFADEIVLSL